MSDYTPTYFRAYSPRVRVLVKDIETADLLYDLSDDLTSIATNKAYGRCSGTWQIMLTYHSRDWKFADGSPLEYAVALQPNMMVTIEMDAGNGAGFFPVMCGLIDRVSEVRQGGLVPHRSVKVSGRDMGKLLETHDVAFDIIAYNRELATQDGTTKPVTRMCREFDPTVSMGNPVDIISRVTDICLGTLTTTKRIAFVSDCEDSFQVHQPNMMSTQGVKLWSYLKQVEHAPYNILSTDTALGNVDAFMILLERLPVSGVTGQIERADNRWHTIGDAEIIEEDLGVSDGERINFLSYQPALQGMRYDVAMVHPDLTHLDEESIKQNGLCARVFQDSFTPPEMQALYDADEQHQIDATITAKRLSETYWAWFKDIHTYETGTATIHLRPDIRIGSGLLIKQRDSDEYKEYLIEQVIHQCVFGERPAFTTTLHLTRGQKASPRAVDKAGPPKPVTDKSVPAAGVTVTTNNYNTEDPETAAEARRLHEIAVQARQDALNKKLGR